MTLKLCVCACVFKGLNGRKRKTFLSSFVAHLSAAIIPYHENQFGSAPPMTNTAISALLLRRLGQLDRWIPFPEHRQIVSWLHWVIWSDACTCVFCARASNRPRDLSHQSQDTPPPPSLSLSVPLTMKTRETLDTVLYCGRFDQSAAEIPFKPSAEVNRRAVTVTGLCLTGYRPS